MKHPLAEMGAGLWLIALSVASVFVFGSNAVMEPFYNFRPGEAVLYIGGSTTLIVLWIQLAVAVVAAVMKGWIGRWWLGSLLWMALAIVFVAAGLASYLADIEGSPFWES